MDLGEAAKAAWAPSCLRICPFAIVVDTQEKAPYVFANMPHQGPRSALLIVKTVVQTLRTGDYSILGYEHRISIERKSLEDLYRTLGAGRERFKREMSRLNKMDYGAVVIEAGWPQIYDPSQYRDDWRSTVSPTKIYGTMLAWTQSRKEGLTYFPRVDWFPAGSRRMAEVLTFLLLERFWKDRNEGRRSGGR